MGGGCRRRSVRLSSHRNCLKHATNEGSLNLTYYMTFLCLWDKIPARRAWWVRLIPVRQKYQVKRTWWHWNLEVKVPKAQSGTCLSQSRSPPPPPPPPPPSSSGPPGLVVIKVDHMDQIRYYYDESLAAYLVRWSITLYSFEPRATRVRRSLIGVFDHTKN